MNKNINFYTVIAAIMMILSCTPYEDPRPDLGEAPTSELVKFDFAATSENANIIKFTNKSEGFKFLWDFGNGTKAEGTEVTAAYPLKGEYTVTLTIFTKGGMAKNTKVVSIANTNPLMLDRPDYNLLTGGANQIEGKTWIIDKGASGHMGVGPAAGNFPEWWAAPANDKEGMGLYDDEYTFKLAGFAFDMKTNGDIFVNNAHVATFGGSGDGQDQKLSYNPPASLTWTIVDEGDNKFLQISDGGFIGFYTGVRRYQILSLTENEMSLKFLDSKNPDLAWYHKLIRKGFSRPAPVIPYKSEDIFANFDIPGNVIWKTGEILGFEDTYDNPAPVGVNTSRKVAKYRRGAGEAHMWTNLQIELGYKIDLRERNKFTLKVFMPGYNDYTTESAPDWWPVYRKLTKQVALKLQNSEHGAPWETQAEVIAQVNILDQWIELEFDFGSFAERTDLDKIVLQIGGEGHFIPGIFFFDDFKLLP
jgi:PKD repeat protein